MSEDTVTVIVSFYIFIESLAIVLGVIGNLLVIYVVVTEACLARRSNKYILSTAIADFLIGSVVNSFEIYKVSEIEFC